MRKEKYIVVTVLTLYASYFVIGMLMSDQTFEVRILREHIPVMLLKTKECCSSGIKHILLEFNVILTDCNIYLK